MTLDAKDMTAAEFRAARDTAVRDARAAQQSVDAGRNNAARIVRFRDRHPDLAAKADEIAHQAHRAAIRAIVAAQAELLTAGADARPAAQAKHEAAVAEAERLHAALGLAA